MRHWTSTLQSTAEVVHHRVRGGISQNHCSSGKPFPIPAPSMSAIVEKKKKKKLQVYVSGLVAIRLYMFTA